MLHLVRGSCKIIGIETKDKSDLINFLSTHFEIIEEGEYTEKLMDEAFALAQEGDVMIFLLDEVSKGVLENDRNYLLLLRTEVDQVLSSIVNNNVTAPTVISIIPFPRPLILRLVGLSEKVIKEVAEDIGGMILPRTRAIEDIKIGTLIYFSENGINKPVTFSKVNNTVVHTNAPYHQVLRFLRNQNLKYLNIGIDNKDWYELKIKIYDSYGKFDLHYDRLRYMLEKFEMGLILGESWGTDMAAMFQHVGIYKVRFFTFKSPLEIKKFLKGLEYLDSGERICDYDLYEGRKKIHWDEVQTKEPKSKPELGKHYRNLLIQQLSEEELDILFDYEQLILESKHSDK